MPRAHIKLVMLTNDLTLRNLMPAEYAKGVGPYRAKPARAYAPIAVATRTLGERGREPLLNRPSAAGSTTSFSASPTPAGTAASTSRR